MRHETKGSTALYFCSGIAAGCAIAMLVTPYSGLEARGRIKTRLASGKAKMNREAERLKHKSEQLVEHAAEVVDAGKRKVTDAMRRMDAAVQAGKQAYGRPNAGIGQDERTI
jgi:gas vesicle protein